VKLPPQWKLRSLGEFIAELEAGVSVNADDIPAADGEPGVLKVSAVFGGRFFPMESKRVLPSERVRLAVTPRRGSIIISRSNTALLVAENAYVEKDYPTLFLSDKLWQTIYRTGVAFEPLWLSQVLQSPRVRQQLVRLATGTSRSMKNIGKSTFLDLEVPTPPLGEQRKLAAILNRWDSAIGKVQSLLVAKANRSSALRRQLLSGQRRFSKYGRVKWRRVLLSDILEHIFRPVNWSPTEMFRLISIRRRCGGLFRREDLLGADYKTTDLHEIRTGDFLVSKRQVVHGAWAMVTKEFSGCHVSKEYSILVNKAPDALHMPFFDWLSHEQRMWHLAFLASDGVHREKLIFDSKDFLRHYIELPPTIEEQQRIVELLDACDQEIRLLEAELEALKQQKRGLMQKLLTGEIRVKTK